MIPTEVIDFLLPHAGDPIQIFILVVLVGMLLFAIFATYFSAKPERWEIKWTRAAPGEVPGKLGIEHGSVTDLWNAVATAPEKLSEVMPSLMLVVGLLGTFLGLGLALNHASNILGKPDALSAAGAAGSMNDLVGLLHGLGTKFKTSTWGIIGFILLRIHSELTRHDERRLQWVIGKVQNELTTQHEERAREQATRRHEQFEKMEQVGAMMARTFSESIASGFRVHGDLVQRLHHDQALKLDKHGASLAGGILRLGADLAAAGDRQADAVCASLSDLAHRAQERGEALRGDLADRFSMVDSALQSQTGVLVAELQSMSNDSQATRGAIEAFSNHTEDVLSGMRKGAEQVSMSSKELSEAVAKLQLDLKKVLNDVRDGLSKAIESLGKEAANALTKGSEKLATSSARIEEVLKTLSNELKQTMGEVNKSVAKVNKLQSDSTTSLAAAASGLTEHLEISGGQFSKLGKDILTSLQDVSKVGAQIRGVVGQLEEFPTTVAEAMIATQPDKPLPEYLEALRALPAEIARALSGIAGRAGGALQLEAPRVGRK